MTPVWIKEFLTLSIKILLYLLKYMKNHLDSILLLNESFMICILLSLYNKIDYKIIYLL
jgi:hypothetical protein